MSRVDRSPAAVAARIREALRLGREARAEGALAKGVRPGGAAVRDRIRRVDELRLLALRLGGRRV